MNKVDLQAAAFWDGLICLDCEEILEASEGPMDLEAPCPLCGGDEVYSAAFVLRCADLVEGEE